MENFQKPIKTKIYLCGAGVRVFVCYFGYVIYGEFYSNTISSHTNGQIHSLYLQILF